METVNIRKIYFLLVMWLTGRQVVTTNMAYYSVAAEMGKSTASDIGIRLIKIKNAHP